MGGFRELRVWQEAMDLVVEVYRISALFPKAEVYGLTAQVRRAAVSIPSNIAEGQARQHVGEFAQLLTIAQGSLAEVQTQVEIAGRLGYIGTETTGAFIRQAGTVARGIYALRGAVRAKGA